MRKYPTGATAATRDGIVRAACDLFRERTYEDITLAEIAAAAGVSHQTVLNHFESKQGVMLAVAVVMRLRTAEIRGKAKPCDVKNAVTVLFRCVATWGSRARKPRRSWSPW